MTRHSISQTKLAELMGKSNPSWASKLCSSGGKYSLKYVTDVDIDKLEEILDIDLNLTTRLVQQGSAEAATSVAGNVRDLSVLFECNSRIESIVENLLELGNPLRNLTKERKIEVGNAIIAKVETARKKRKLDKDAKALEVAEKVVDYFATLDLT